MDGSLTNVDFDYSFEETKPHSTKYMFSEMTSRLQYNGFKKNPSKAIEDYPEKQKYIQDGEFKAIESDIVKYIQKIIDLCKKNNVELIFYRSPYTSRVNELKKLNHMRQICEENGVLFIDTEAELQFSYLTDFLDYEHLSEVGANKATELMIPYILEALERQGVKLDNPSEGEQVNLIVNGDFVKNVEQGGKSTFFGKGEFIDGWRTNYAGDTITLTDAGVVNVNASTEVGWHLHQVMEKPEELIGKTLTAVYQIGECNGENIRPVISCRNAENKEIDSSSARIENGKITLSIAVPEGTEYIRVGFFAYEGVAPGESVEVRSIEMYEGAYTLETLPTL